LIRRRTGVVLSVITQRPGISEIAVDINGRRERAINYEKMTGPVRAGDRVLLNTTAVSVSLGTGGYHYVMAVEGSGDAEAAGEGHIMKLRYTPAQVKVLAVEEQAHPASGAYRFSGGLEGTPVVVGTLHSMLAPAAAAIRSKAGPRLKITYLMTDGGALPLWFSRLVQELKSKGLVDETITCGHAFGGDYEAVNVYSGLLWARANGAGVVIAAMGPGIVGTASEFGHTAIEQGEIVNAVSVLGGRAIAVPRISFADARPRHYGVSHHTLTALGKVALAGCTVVVPVLQGNEKFIVEKQLRESGIDQRHRVVEREAGCAGDILGAYGLQVTTMGRSPAQDPAFFETACAAGLFAAELVQAGADKTLDRNIC
jgi:hypothetical protein